MACALLLAALPVLAQPTLVKDIKKSVRPVQPLGYSELKAANGLLCFAFDDGVHEVPLFPNPVRDRLSVTLPFPASQVEATAVTDAKGTPLLRDAHRQTGAQALEIYTEGLPAGLYLFHVDAPQGSRWVKFIKQ